MGMTTPGCSAPTRSPAHRRARVLLNLVGLVAVAAASIVFALRVTPLQTVSTAGQTVKVGAAPPSLDLDGPGVLDLFGQSLPTTPQFSGPVRPRLVLTNITINAQLSGVFSDTNAATPTDTIGQRLADGWRRYFIWELVFVAVGAVVLTAAYLGIRRPPLRRSIVTLVVAVAFAEAVNLGGVMYTAYSAPRILAKTTSLSALVGRREDPPIAADPGPPIEGVQTIVIGDSTAAGDGNALVADPSDEDRACHRSADSFAAVLARVNRWNVENLACGSATIRAGLLGTQTTGGTRVPAQLAVAKRAPEATTIIVSIGANDLGWTNMLRLCAVSDTCDDAASTAFFQLQLDQFSTNYYDLLRQLAALPNNPVIVINQYYVPFDPKLHCLEDLGLTTSKQRVLLDRLGALNAVLAKGAKTFAFRTTQPDFSGHTLCADDPYVQGLADPAPFHPTVSGQLAIALADLRAITGAHG